MPIQVGDYIIGYDPETRLFYRRHESEWYGDRLREWAGAEKPKKPMQMGEVGAIYSKFGRWESEENPDTLVQAKGLSVYRDMLKDEAVAAGTTLLALGVVGAGYTIDPPETEEPQGQEVADFIKRVLAMMRGPFKQVELGLLTARWNGFALAELVYGFIKEGEYAGKVGLSRIACKPPDNYGFDLDVYGNVESIRYSPPDGTPDKHFPYDKWVHYAHDHGDAFGSPYGRSQLRSVYRYYKARKLVFPMWAQFVEKAATGMPVASYPRGILPNEVAVYEKLVQHIMASAGAAKPSDVELDWMEKMGHSHEEFQKFDAYCAAAILRGILVPTQMGIAFETEVGSKAKAAVHQRLFEWVSGDMDTDLTNCIQEQVIQRVVDLNYDVNGAYPVYKRPERNPEDAIAVVTAFVMAAEKGVVGEVGREDENRVRRLLEFSEVTEEEWEEREREAAHKAEKMAKQMRERPPDTDEDKEKVDDTKTQVSVPKGVPGTKPKVEAADGEVLGFSRTTEARVEKGLHDNPAFMRELSAVERAVGVDVKGIDRRLRAMEAHAQKDIVAAFSRIQRRLLDNLRRRGLLDGSGTLLDLYSFDTIDGTGRGKVRDILYRTELTGAIMGALDCSKEIERGTAGEVEFEAFDRGAECLAFDEMPYKEGPFDAKEARQYFGTLTPITAKNAAAMKARAFWIAGLELDEHGELLRDVKFAIERGFASGNWSAVEATINARFEEWVGSGRLSSKGGLYRPWHTEVIVRNASMRGYNYGRVVQMQRAGLWVEANQWSSIIDSRTSDHCEEMDGKVFHSGEVEPPPAHHQCRSMLIPVTKGQQYSLAPREELLEAAKLRDPAWTSGVID